MTSGGGGVLPRQRDLVRVIVVGSPSAGRTTLVNALAAHEGASQASSAEPRTGRPDRDADRDPSSGIASSHSAHRAPIQADITERRVATASREIVLTTVPDDAQSTRGMVAAASTANVAIDVIDAQTGVRTRSREHALIASLMGVPRLVVVVNKLDLVAYDPAVFERIKEAYGAFVARLHFADVVFIPTSALVGDNVARASARTPWYTGQPLLPYLDAVYIAGDANLVDFRFPVARVERVENGRLGFVGEVASGVVRPDDLLAVVPSGERTRVTRITVAGEALAQAAPPMSVTLCVANEVAVSPGDLLAHPANVPPVERAIEAMVVWLADAPLAEGDVYLVAHTTRVVRGSCARIAYKINPDTLRREAVGALARNEIGRARLTLFEPLFVDEHRKNRVTGALTLLDPETRATVGAAVVIERRIAPAIVGEDGDEPISRNVFRQRSRVDAAERGELLRQQPLTVWLTGLSGSGKSTIGHALERRLVDAGHACFVLDGDNLRHGLNRNLGFTPEDRRENVRRTAEAARLMNDAGLIVIIALISPYAEDRAMAARVIGPGRFFETYLAAGVDACEQRDPKGLYAKARRGEIAEFTGVSAPYEPPAAPTLVLDTGVQTVEESVELLFAAVSQRVKPAA